MHMLLTHACNPQLSLRNCLHRWPALAARLREPSRSRTYQCENEAWLQ
jgi:hypothetical protein